MALCGHQRTESGTLWASEDRKWHFVSVSRQKRGGKNDGSDLSIGESPPLSPVSIRACTTFLLKVKSGRLVDSKEILWYYGRLLLVDRKNTSADRNRVEVNSDRQLTLLFRRPITCQRHLPQIVDEVP